MTKPTLNQTLLIICLFLLVTGISLKVGMVMGNIIGYSEGYHDAVEDVLIGLSGAEVNMNFKVNQTEFVEAMLPEIKSLLMEDGWNESR